MANKTDRKSIRAKLEQKIGKKQPVIIGAAGNGLSARLYDIAEADLILTNSTGDIVLNGHPSTLGSMYYGDANKLAVKVAENALLRAGNTPVVAGLGATDPFRNVDVIMEDLLRKGACGVCNTPSVSIYYEERRAHLQNGGFGYTEEMAMLKRAGEMGLFTIGMIKDAEDAKRMLKEAKPDMLLVNVGFTVGGLSGVNEQKAMPLDVVAETVQAVCDVAKKDAIVVCTGGLLNTPENVQYVFKNCDAQGFVGGSATERLPIERSVASTVESFLTLTTRP